jgi:hypothetical protein
MKLSLMRLLGVLFTLAAALSSAPSLAGYTPIGFGIAPPAQLPPKSFSIVGARLSAGYGVNKDVYGVDLGTIGNITENQFVGIGVSGLFNWNKGHATVIGLQAALGANINVNKARIVGLQVSGWNANLAESTMVGVGLGLGNQSPNMTMIGLQAGLYNTARHVYGFQIGLVNRAENLHGIQIGLLNFNTHGLFSLAPIMNIGF